MQHCGDNINGSRLFIREQAIKCVHDNDHGIVCICIYIVTHLASSKSLHMLNIQLAPSMALTFEGLTSYGKTLCSAGTENICFVCASKLTYSSGQVNFNMSCYKLCLYGYPWDSQLYMLSILYAYIHQTTSILTGNTLIPIYRFICILVAYSSLYIIL